MGIWEQVHRWVWKSGDDCKWETLVSTAGQMCYNYVIVAVASCSYDTAGLRYKFLKGNRLG